MIENGAATDPRQKRREAKAAKIVAEAWIRKRVFESFEDSPAGHIAKLAGMLAPVAPGFVVSPDALGDCGVRPTKAEWSRLVSACDLVRCIHAETA